MGNGPRQCGGKFPEVAIIPWSRNPENKHGSMPRCQNGVSYFPGACSPEDEAQLCLMIMPEQWVVDFRELALHESERTAENLDGMLWEDNLMEDGVVYTERDDGGHWRSEMEPWKVSSIRIWRWRITQCRLDWIIW
jgi:hypothetical protein